MTAVHSGRVVDTEVVVIGGGPAGAAAAYWLAERGRSVVVLDRQRFPRDKSCGDGLTPRAVRVLDEMGLLPALAGAQRISGVRVQMRGKGCEEFDYPPNQSHPEYGLVVPRLVLDHAILNRAREAGVEVWEGARAFELIEADDAVEGVRCRRDGEDFEVRAPVTVLAAGAASNLLPSSVARGAGEGLGFAIRTYLHGLEGLDDKLEIYLPILDVSDRYLLPSYGWLFPVDGTSANFGIGLFGRVHEANLRQLAEGFLKERMEIDARLAGAHPTGGWKGAPLRFDFSPDRCARRGLAVVGDAAGLVSPFTGEGISYALESARLAADIIDRNLQRGFEGPLNLSDYAMLMEREYTGYFEAGRRSARRYALVWHILEDTFDRRGPIFMLARRALLFPEGAGEVYPSRILKDVRPLIAPGLNLREQLMGVGDVMMGVVRREWPFLGVSWLGSRGDPGIPFRPALLFLLAAHAGDPNSEHLKTVAAALELGYLAALAQLSVEEEDDITCGSSSDVPGNWGNMGAVMLGDFLLTKAYALSAEAGAWVSQLIAQALDRACGGQVEELANAYDPSLDESRHLDVLARTTVPLFALPCRLGAALAGASSEHTEALAEYGSHLGLAYRLADDALQLKGEVMALGSTAGLDLRRGVYSLGILRAAALPQTGADLRARLGAELDDEEVAGVVELVLTSGVLPGVLAVARTYAERARCSLGLLPPGPLKRSLVNLTEFAVTQNAGEPRDLRSAL